VSQSACFIYKCHSNFVKKMELFPKCGNILTTLCIRRNGIMNTHKSTLEMAVIIVVFCNLSLIYEALVAPCFFVIVHWSCFLFSFFFFNFPFWASDPLTRTRERRCMAQAVSYQPLTMEAWFSPCGICVWDSGTGAGFSSSSLVLLCQ
jgi:hypothetical protein